MSKSSRQIPNDKKLLLETWKQCEQVAMHFNVLLQGFRLKAVGGDSCKTQIEGDLFVVNEAINEAESDS